MSASFPCARVHQLGLSFRPLRSNAVPIFLVIIWTIVRYLETNRGFRADNVTPELPLVFVLSEGVSKPTSKLKANTFIVLETNTYGDGDKRVFFTGDEHFSAGDEHVKNACSNFSHFWRWRQTCFALEANTSVPKTNVLKTRVQTKAFLYHEYHVASGPCSSYLHV